LNTTPSAVDSLLREPFVVPLRPSFEGANISFAIGFKHINYLAESAVIERFRAAGLPVGGLYERYGLGFDVVDISSRLGMTVHGDDEVRCLVRPSTRDGSDQLAFEVTMSAERDGEERKLATSKVRVALRIDDHVKAVEPIPAELNRFAVPRLGTATPRPLSARPVPSTVHSRGRGTTGPDPVLAELTAGRNAFGWKWRVPYFYCHFSERMQMSAFLRVLEEVVDLFLAERGLPIRPVLHGRGWIPVVTASRVQLLDEVLMEEDLYTVYTVQDIFKDLLYTSRMDCYVVRDDQLVPVATGTITHGYMVEGEHNQWSLVTFDEDTRSALRGEPARVG
jgi:acyl-CoA thioesterase FadM